MKNRIRNIGKNDMTIHISQGCRDLTAQRLDSGCQIFSQRRDCFKDKQTVDHRRGARVFMPRWTSFCRWWHWKVAPVRFVHCDSLERPVLAFEKGLDVGRLADRILRKTFGRIPCDFHQNNEMESRYRIRAGIGKNRPLRSGTSIRWGVTLSSN